MFKPKLNHRFIYQFAQTGSQTTTSPIENPDKSKESKDLTKGIEATKIIDESTQKRADVALEKVDSSIDRTVQEAKIDSETPKDISGINIEKSLETKEQIEAFDIFQVALTTLISKVLNSGVKLENLYSLDKFLEQAKKYYNIFNLSEKKVIDKLKEVVAKPNAIISKMIISDWSKYLNRSKGNYKKAQSLKEKPEGWMKKHPYMATGLVVAGAYGAYKIFKWMFGDDEKKDSSWWSGKKGGFFTKIAASVLGLFTLGGLLRTDFMKGGVDGLQTWIKEKLGLDLGIERVTNFLGKITKGDIAGGLKDLFGEVVEKDPFKDLHKKAAQDIETMTGKKIDTEFLIQIGKEKINDVIKPNYLDRKLKNLKDYFIGLAKPNWLPSWIPFIGSDEKMKEQEKAIEEYFTKYQKQKIEDLQKNKKIDKDTTIDQVWEILLESKTETTPSKPEEGSGNVAPLAGAVIGAVPTKPSEKPDEGAEDDKGFIEKNMPETKKVIDKIKEDFTDPNNYAELAKSVFSEGGTLVCTETFFGIFKAGKWLLISTQKEIINISMEIYRGNEWFSKPLGITMMVAGPVLAIGAVPGAALGALKGFSFNPLKAMITIPKGIIQGAYAGAKTTAKLPFTFMKRLEDFKQANILSRFARDSSATTTSLIDELTVFAKKRGYVFNPDAAGKVTMKVDPTFGTYFSKSKIPEPLQKQISEQYETLLNLRNNKITNITDATSKGLVDTDSLAKGEFKLFKFTDYQKELSLIEKTAKDLKNSDVKTGNPLLANEKYRENAINQLKSSNQISSMFKDPHFFPVLPPSSNINTLAFKDQISHLKDLSAKSDEYLRNATAEIEVMKAAGKSATEISAYESQVLANLDKTRTHYKEVFEKLNTKLPTMDKDAKKAFEKLIKEDLSKATGVRGLWREVKGRGKYALVFGVANAIYQTYSITKENKEKQIKNEIGKIILEVGLETFQLIVDIMCPFGISDWYTVISGRTSITQQKVEGWRRWSRAIFGTYSMASDILAVIGLGVATPVGGVGIYAAGNAAEVMARAAKQGPGFYKTCQRLIPRLLELGKNIGGIDKLAKLLKNGDYVRSALIATKSASKVAMTGVLIYDVGKAGGAFYDYYYNTKGEKEMELDLGDSV